jgi:hypothetical protein
MYAVTSLGDGIASLDAIFTNVKDAIVFLIGKEFDDVSQERFDSLMKKWKSRRGDTLSLVDASCNENVFIRKINFSKLAKESRKEVKQIEKLLKE